MYRRISGGLDAMLLMLQPLEGSKGGKDPTLQYSTVPTLRKPHSHHSALASRDVHSHLEGSGGCGEAGHRVRATLSVLVDLSRTSSTGIV